MVLGPEMIEDMVKQVKLIHEKIKAAPDQLKSYADLKRRKEEYEVGEKVLLKISPMKETIEMDENLTYEERPVKILDSKVRSIRNKDVSIVKVLWSNQKTKEATWETEADMRKRYLELFT
ncbi:uncharacterized protein LOC110732152 [Chenopodium quinoa]|uniref:uncharacterized protein LOC110732152 n=1 Tax=Chenopodium quinoa TaxID=63459 RepID=UPI000B78929F|nr:uncharacterized protein LOC110732152 [Chenopodium quinoa]